MKMTEEGARERAVQAVGIHRTDHTINCITNAILTACAAESEVSAAQPVTKEREKSVEFARNDEAAKWSPIVDALQQTAEKLAAQLASVTKELGEARDELSEAFKDAVKFRQELAEANRLLEKMPCDHRRADLMIEEHEDGGPAGTCTTKYCRACRERGALRTQLASVTKERDKARKKLTIALTALKAIHQHGTGSGVIPCPQDYNFYIDPIEREAWYARNSEVATLKAELEALRKVAEARKSLPRIVCLCGSGRFKEAFDDAEFNETLAGRIVLTIGCNTKDIARSAELAHHKPALDELHKRKIDLADEVYVLNVGEYIGESTRNEIEYAEAHGKPIRYLEALAAAKEPHAG